MDWAASAIKPGRRSLHGTSMDGRRAGVAIFQTGTPQGRGVRRLAGGGALRSPVSPDSAPRAARAPHVHTAALGDKL